MMTTSTVPMIATVMGMATLLRQDGTGDLRVTMKKQTGMQNTAGHRKTAVQD